METKKQTAKKVVKGENVETKKPVSNPFKTITENLPFWDFQVKPIFEGIFEQQLTLGESEPFTANVFVDIKTGERVFITNSYAIEKTIAKVREVEPDLKQVVFQIEFIEKTLVNGKPFNKFNTGYCSLQQYQEIFK